MVLEDSAAADQLPVTVPDWRDPARRPGLPPRARRFLAAELGVPVGDVAPVPPAPVRVPPSALPGSVVDRLAAVVGPAHLYVDAVTRGGHAGGQAYRDLVRRRHGDLPAPDAVVTPADHDEVAAVLAACSDAPVAVVPYGGGTSVVGGVEALRGPFEAVVAVDLTRLGRLLAVDAISQTATVEAGMTGPALAAALAERGMILGHLPQSFERATVGGWLAARSAGQASTGYGRIDELVESLVVATPAGDLRPGRAPASAAGPDLRALLVGSEGAFGIVTAATLRVRPLPAVRRYEGWSFRTFADGLEALRLLAQDGLAPDVCRLSDPEETRVTLAQAGRNVLGALYLRARGHTGGCLAIFGWEGSTAAVRRRRRPAAAVLRSHGGIVLGTGPGRAWEHGRFGAPYLREDLLDAGLLVETLETATSWRDLPALWTALRAALGRTLRRPLVFAHVSHVYPTGASLYVTILDAGVAAGGDPAEVLHRWDAAKTAATDAIVAGGGTVSHHHGVGAEHRSWLAEEIGPLGVDVLAAVKRQLDPAGILNPGKLLP